MLENSLLSAEVKEGEILPPTIQKLMKGYNKYLRPFFDNGPVTVGMSLDIASIDTISEINMDYTATIFLRQRWTDERLVFEGNKSLSLDGRLVELLWVPDTFIVDSKKITTTVACNMDLTKYPMDKQTCTLQLESWGYNINDVMFYWTRGNESVSGLDTLRLAQYTVEDHYTSASEAIYETGHYPKLIFHFELKRSILYFILETYVPSSLLVVLSWVSFWISQSSVPARICIGVTTVLTMTTLMMGARTSLPNANCFIKAIDYGHQMGGFDEEMNGMVTTIAAENNRAKRRKEKAAADAAALAPTAELELCPSSPTGSEPKPEAPEEPTNRCLIVLVLLRKVLRKAANCCHVENPHLIDNYSRMTFPLSFVFVNLLYWTYYLYL
ncbi:unnamed protein product [Coregonus sp. 'balchen']|nr:unnamed protein product [Coregonus sp. 'balchen']